MGGPFLDFSPKKTKRGIFPREIKRVVLNQSPRMPSLRGLRAQFPGSRPVVICTLLSYFVFYDVLSITIIYYVCCWKIKISIELFMKIRITESELFLQSVVVWACSARAYWDIFQTFMMHILHLLFKKLKSAIQYKTVENENSFRTISAVSSGRGLLCMYFLSYLSNLLRCIM